MAPRILVVGAGITGASLAYHLARRGAAVTVIEAGQPASGASGASFGWLNASFFANEDHFRLRAAALMAHRCLCEALPGLPTAWTGTLWWEDEGAAFDRQTETLTRLGYPLRVLDRAAFAELEPNVPPPDRALLFPDEGATDLAGLTARLLDAAGQHGARLWTGTPVAGLATRNGQVCGVETAQGPVPADHVVLAAGTATPALIAPLGLRLPMLRRPGLILRTRPADPPIHHILVAPGQEVRQDVTGHLIAPTSASHQGDTADTVADTPERLADAALARLRALLPGAALEWDRVMLADRPVPRDGLPVIGPGGVPGLSLAVMHSGATLAPLVGELLSDEVLCGTPSALLAPFRPDRF